MADDEWQPAQYPYLLDHFAISKQHAKLVAMWRAGRKAQTQNARNRTMDR
jgi:hypothetical protein